MTARSKVHVSYITMISSHAQFNSHPFDSGRYPTGIFLPSNEGIEIGRRYVISLSNNRGGGKEKREEKEMMSICSLQLGTLEKSNDVQMS